MLNAGELEQLVTASRGGDGAWRQRLPEVAGTVRQLLRLIERGGGEAEEAQAALQHDLLLCFRAMRNACAAGPAACAVLLGLGLLDLVRATLDLISTATIALNWQLPAAVAQALANLCNACGASAAATWAALFPLHLGMLAHVNAGSTQAPTCLALLACSKAVHGATAALASSQGSQIMAALLCNHQRMLQQGEANDNLGLLAARLCFGQDLLPTLFQSLAADADGASGSNSDSSSSGTLVQPTMAQAALLEVLCAEAQDMPQQAEECAVQGASERGSREGRGASMRFLVHLAQELAAHSKAQGPLSAGQQQVLQDCLHLMRDLAARDDSGRELAGGACLVSELQAAGFLPALLAMLKALRPIQNPQRQRQAAAAAPAPVGSESSSSGGGGGGIQVAELAPQLAQQAQRFPADPPYHGFRTDLLAAVSNAAHKRPTVQAEVHVLGGVELVLAQCQLDQASPLAREWALWGVRNLCEGNPRAQEAIRQLQLCTTVDNEELQRLGVKLELDEHSGKLKVSKREPGGD